MKQFIFILALVVQSCSYHMYEPNPPLAPLFQKKGQIQASGQLTSMYGFDFHLNSSISDHIYVGTNIFRTTSKSSVDFITTYAEVSGGWYQFKKRDHELIGLGFGLADATSKKKIGNERGRYYRLFAQFQKGISYKFFEVSTICRLSYMNEVNHREYTSGKWVGKKEDHGLFMEPAGRVGIGSKNIKLIGQLGFSYTLPETGKEKISLNFSGGLSSQFDLFN
ncbi:hypothetical protein L6Q79_16145 [bacterium]|nr:hypothetical protein [bacterium]